MKRLKVLIVILAGPLLLSYHKNPTADLLSSEKEMNQADRIYPPIGLEQGILT